MNRGNYGGYKLNEPTMAAEVHSKNGSLGLTPNRRTDRVRSRAAQQQAQHSMQGRVPGLLHDHTTRRPLSNPTRNNTIATTNKTWMNAPIV